ncbi:MAG: Gfo/Idh/MocA family protein [Candidatus Zipacnadales bacterium]
MSSTPTRSRRQFMEEAAMGALYVAAASSVSAQPRRTSPNERIHIGLIGCGGMGRGNLGNCAAYSDVVVTGACDVWPERREAVVAQYKESCKPYHDYREMLAQDDIDAVIIATPPHWHALMAIDACKAGKDIYVQKPMTLHVGESLALRNAVRKHKRICQVGTQIHASENYRRVVELIRSGNLGEIGVVRTFHVLNQAPQGIGKGNYTDPPQGFDWDMWCGPAPLGRYNSTLVANSFNHCFWFEYTGGWTPGMAPHVIDLPVWALDLGFPTETTCAGGRYILDDDGDAYDNQDILWRYPKLTMHWWTSTTNSYGFDFHGDPTPRRRLGIYFHGTNGTLFADYGMHKVVAEGDKMDGMTPPEPSIPPSPGHEREWLDCIKSRQQPSCCPDYHVRVDVPIALGNLSYRLGRSIRFDPDTESIVGDKEAARLAIPKYREPWRFPKEYLEG